MLGANADLPGKREAWVDKGEKMAKVLSVFIAETPGFHSLCRNVEAELGQGLSNVPSVFTHPPERSRPRTHYLLHKGHVIKPNMNPTHVLASCRNVLGRKERGTVTILSTGNEGWGSAFCS